jgi:predicted kinase
MKKFQEFTELEEALIILGKKAYPKFGHIVIMAGGAGSGKGFVKDKLLGIEGWPYDVDDLKKLAMKSPMIQKAVKKEFGVELEKMNLKNPDDVSKLHEILKFHLNIDDKKTKALYTGILTKAPDRKPNIIFDVTLKDLNKLDKLARMAKQLNYDPKNIHIVWVVNDVEIALKQNANRERTVDASILINTHRGVSSTMYDIIKMGKGLSKYMDGDIVFAFNKIGVDSELKTSARGGSYIDKANYFYVKRSGKPPMQYKEISKDIRQKISSYVPKGVNWV